jgi:hypothetical protein
MSYTFTLQRLSDGKRYITLEQVHNDRILQLLIERTKTSWTFDPLAQIYTYEEINDRTY